MTTINLLLTVTPDPLQVGGDRHCEGVTVEFPQEPPGGMQSPTRKALGSQVYFTTPPLDAWTGGKVESGYPVGGQVLPDLQRRLLANKYEEERWNPRNVKQWTPD